MSNKIGRFEILSEISHSAIGHVYKASDPENGQTVALKTLELKAIGEHVSEMVQRLVQESQGTSVLSSHNIAQLLGVDEIEGQFVAALEYVQGNSVATMLARNEGFSIWDIKDIGRQSAQALDHAHSRKVFHYSLEPDKVMSGWDGTVKVLGFGVSAMSIPSALLHGNVPAMAHYMSPEQWLGQPVDARSNLFSLGAILYEMMTEQRAFGGDDEETVKRQALEVEPAMPHTVNNKISLEISAAIMKALAKNPADRYATGQDLVNALEGHKEATTVKSAPKKTAEPAKGLNIPKAAAPVEAKSATPAPPAQAKVAAPQPTAPKPSVAAKPAAAAAAAGWGGTGAGSPAREQTVAAPPDASEDLTGSLMQASVAAASKPHATMSAAPAAEPVEETVGFKVDPAMDENRSGGSASRSFSEITELPPLKEVYVAPPTPAEEEAPPPPPPPPVRGRTAARDEKPKVQPRVVAKKAVAEIKKTPPQLFGYALAGAIVIIVLIVVGIAWKIHSDNAGDDGSVRSAVSEQAPEPAQAAPAPAPVVAAPDDANEPDVITVKSKPAPRKAKAVPVAVVPGQLTVNSTPEGAQVVLDGQSYGVSPLELTDIAPGQHTVTVGKAGYTSETRMIEVASRSKSVLVVQLAMVAASLAVTSDPAGAKVIVDGKDLGKVTPLQLSMDKPGNHSVLVRKEGYLDESTTLNLQAGQTSHFTPALRKLGVTDEIKVKKFLGGGAPQGSGLVSVKVQPKGAQVAVNRRIVDKSSPVEFYLNPGIYMVDITASGYKPLHKVITVEKGSKTAIEESLQTE